MTVLFWLDLVLVVLVSLRLTRLVIVDDLGVWFVQEPAERVLNSGAPAWVKKAAMGASCGFCLGFWVGSLVLASLWLAGGPGEAVEVWRWCAGAFALNYVVGHLHSRMD